jgi:hypothetical protein
VILNVNSLKSKIMVSMDGSIEPIYFLIISLGLTLLTYLVFKKNGKSIEVYFLGIMTVLFYVSYFILIIVKPS